MTVRGALSDLGGADVHLDRAVGARRTEARETGCAPAASRPTDTPRPTPGGAGSSQPIASATFSTSPTRSASSGLPPVGRTSSPGTQQVAAPELERVEAGAPRDLVDLRLADPLQVACPEGPVGAGGRGAGVHAVAVHADGPPAVGPRRGVAGGGADARAVVRVRARVEVEADLAREQRAVRARAGAHPGAHAVAARREHRLRDAVLNPHRPPRVAGERRRDRLHLGVRLRAEPAAEVGHDHAHRVERHAEQVGDLGADEERVLAGRPQRDPVRRGSRTRPCASPSRTGRRRGTRTRPPPRCAPRRRRPRRCRSRAGSGSRRCRPPPRAGRGRGRGPARSGSSCRQRRVIGERVLDASRPPAARRIPRRSQRRAASASASVSAATAATGSPAKRTRSSASTGRSLSACP